MITLGTSGKLITCNDWKKVHGPHLTTDTCRHSGKNVIILLLSCRWQEGDLTSFSLFRKWLFATCYWCCLFTPHNTILIQSDILQSFPTHFSFFHLNFFVTEIFCWENNKRNETCPTPTPGNKGKQEQTPSSPVSPY